MGRGITLALYKHIVSFSIGGFVCSLLHHLVQFETHLTFLFSLSTDSFLLQPRRFERVARVSVVKVFPLSFPLITGGNSRGRIYLLSQCLSPLSLSLFAIREKRLDFSLPFPVCPCSPFSFPAIIKNEIGDSNRPRRKGIHTIYWGERGKE